MIPSMSLYLAKIREIRELLGVSQREMAEWLGMSRENYNSSENGRNNKTISTEKLTRMVDHPKYKEAGITESYISAFKALDDFRPESLAVAFEEITRGMTEEQRQELIKKAIVIKKERDK